MSAQLGLLGNLAGTSKNDQADFFASDITSPDNGVITVLVVMSAAGDVELDLSNGTTEDAGHIYNNNNLKADTWYTFQFPVGKNFTFNLNHKVGSAATVSCYVFWQSMI